MSFFNQVQIDQIISFAFEAGEIAAKAQKSGDFTVERKIDNSKVTSADIAVSKFLDEKLSKNFAGIPIVCEEGNLRHVAGDVFWLIDPIDGTSAFASGNNEFCVNIALIKNNKPIFGLIYAPNFDGGKMAVTNAQGDVVIIDKSGAIKPLQPSPANFETLKIVTSNKTKDYEIANFLTQFYPQFQNNFSVQHLSAAVKFFPLLENSANLYLAFRNMMEWDTAAGHALIEAAGGKLKSLTLQDSLYVIGDDLRYNKTNFVNSFFACYRTLP